MKLDNPRHEIFCYEYVYVQNFNAGRAYEAAFGSRTSRNANGVSAHYLLRDPKIKQRIEELKEDVRQKYGIKIQEMVDRLNYLYEQGIADQEFFSKSGNFLGIRKQDLHVSLKSVDMLLKVSGGYHSDRLKEKELERSRLKDEENKKDDNQKDDIIIETNLD